MVYNFSNDQIRWQMSKSIKDYRTFLREFLPFQGYNKFNISYLQNVAQGQGVQFLKLRHSMTNVKIYKSLPDIFALALTISVI